MKREQQVEVEPLSERRWSELRRAVLSRASELPPPASMPPPARARLRRWQTATAVALAAAVVLAWIVTARAPASTSVATSRVVTTAAGATASAGDVTVEVAPFSSVMVLERAEREWLVSVEHGSARFLVPPRGELPPFRVEAGETRIVVIGTRFVVSRAPGASTGEVLVEHGAVRVVEHDEEEILHDGERWPRTAAIEVGPSPTRSALVPDVPASAPSPRTDDREEQDDVVATAIGPQTRSPAPPTRAPSRAREIPEAASVPEAAPPPEAAAPAPLQTARARYEEAAAIEATEPSRAAALYEDLVREGGSWGATALFAEARLELEQHHPARARLLLERYLSEHPEGVNAADARRLLEQLR